HTRSYGDWSSDVCSSDLEFIEALRDLGLLRNSDVLPYLVVRQFHLCGNDAVCIDRVAGVEQEVGPVLAHGGEREHAAVVRIDTPALSGDVAAPDETDVSPVGWCGTEAADHRLARNLKMREVAKLDAIEDILARWKI